MSSNATSNSELRDFIDLSDDSRIKSLIEQRKILRERVIEVNKLLGNIEAEIKGAIGPHAAFQCGEYVGSYKFEPRGAYEVKASNPRVLRISG